MPTPSPLEYAPRPPMHRRRSFRWASVAALVMAFIVSGWWWMPSALQRVQLLYWQHRCLAHIATPGQLVFDSTSGISVVPKEWTEFYNRYSPPGMQSDGTIFLGELKTPSGERRFVAIDIVMFAEMDDGLYKAYPRVFDDKGDAFAQVGSLHGIDPLDLAEAGMPLGFSGSAHGQRRTSLQVYSAAKDPADPSHFTFSITRNGNKMDVEGWLQNDDRVVIGERNPPSTAP